MRFLRRHRLWIGPLTINTPPFQSCTLDELVEARKKQVQQALATKDFGQNKRKKYYKTKFEKALERSANKAKVDKAASDRDGAGAPAAACAVPAFCPPAPPTGASAPANATGAGQGNRSEIAFS